MSFSSIKSTHFSIPSLRQTRICDSNTTRFGRTPISLDIEAVHLTFINETKRRRLPTQICIVDQHRKLLVLRTWEWNNEKINEARQQLEEIRLYKRNFIRKIEVEDNLIICANFKSDLKTLLFTKPEIRSIEWRIRDVNVYYSPYKNCAQIKLRDASYIMFKKMVQIGPHCAIEDSQIQMMLFLYKRDEIERKIKLEFDQQTSLIKKQNSKQFGPNHEESRKLKLYGIPKGYSNLEWNEKMVSDSEETT